MRCCCIYKGIDEYINWIYILHLHAFFWQNLWSHYNDVIMSTMASQITSLTIVYSTLYSGANQRKHKNSASLAFAGNSPVIGKFPAQRASNAENASIWWWRHHGLWKMICPVKSYSISWAVCDCFVTVLSLKCGARFSRNLAMQYYFCWILNNWQS